MDENSRHRQGIYLFRVSMTRKGDSNDHNRQACHTGMEKSFLCVCLERLPQATQEMLPLINASGGEFDVLL